ncbi:histidine kinase [Ulvibacterium marinum]|uniref:histidine kinase n=1 Tax=Ulvibacterium marinum TaxID=2419782 RepID=UPI002494A901|nr:histidine kinase [Ulvibacterium marinum]
MRSNPYITFLFLMLFSTVLPQVSGNSVQMKIEGSVKGRETGVPISGVEVSTNTGEYTLTNAFGEFAINARIGDELVFSSPEFKTVRYTIASSEDVDVLVEGYAGNIKNTRKSSSSNGGIPAHRTLLDSADLYKKTDIEKSIDFIAQSISRLGKRGNKKELARSLTLLGEVYLYHRQYDLAIDNLKDANEANKTVKASLLLGEAYLRNKEFDAARATLLPLLKIKQLEPYRKTKLYEFLGDAFQGQKQLDRAIAYYEAGLQVAKKNQITPKMTDLTSKIADAYANENRTIEAEGFYGNSLELAKQQAPQRAIQEKEKVADFYNKKNRYDEEIQLRKKTLNELLEISSPVVDNGNSVLTRVPDTITSQRINYKIANAYIAQDKYDEALPYLERSIVEADSEDDLVVQKDATRKLSEIYKYKGDYSRALESYQEYVALVDTLYVRKEQEISRAARFNREVAAKQSRITGLEQERELSQSKYDLALTEQQLIQENNKRQKWIIYSLIFGIILTALAAFFFYRSNQQQKLANNLLALKSLRSQMNPHFIFNALNSVNNYIAKSDERSANRYLSEFSTLMRSVLENSEEDFIPLSKELELLELYVKLEHSRFPDKFDYDIVVSDHLDIESYQIPPMLLQPYIENAIWHGLRYKKEKGYLKIHLEQQDKGTLEITIADNGIGRKKSAELKTKNQKKQKSKGMGNIAKRIAILNDMYKNRIAIHISDLNTDGTGTQVTFNLKKK